MGVFVKIGTSNEGSTEMVLKFASTKRSEIHDLVEEILGSKVRTQFVKKMESELLENGFDAGNLGFELIESYIKFKQRFPRTLFNREICEKAYEDYQWFKNISDEISAAEIYTFILDLIYEVNGKHPADSLIYFWFDKCGLKFQGKSSCKYNVEDVKIIFFVVRSYAAKKQKQCRKDSGVKNPLTFNRKKSHTYPLGRC